MKHDKWWEFDPNKYLKDRKRRLHANVIKSSYPPVSKQQNQSPPQTVNPFQKKTGGGHVDEIHQASGSSAQSCRVDDDVEIVADKVETPEKKNKKTKENNSNNSESSQTGKETNSQKENNSNNSESSQTGKETNSQNFQSNPLENKTSVSSEENWSDLLDETAFDQENNQYHNHYGKNDDLSNLGHRASASKKTQMKRNNTTKEVFHESCKLIKMFLDEEDFSEKEHSFVGKYNTRGIVKNIIEKKYHKIPLNRWQHPKRNNVALFLDISESCSAQAGMFLAIGASVICEPGFRVFLGYNGYCDPEPLKPPKLGRRLTYEQSLVWSKEMIEYYFSPEKSDWRVKNYQTYNRGISIENYLQTVKNPPNTVIFFGDYDGLDIYNRVVNGKIKNRINVYWFCSVLYENQRLGSTYWRENKTFFPNIVDEVGFKGGLTKLIKVTK